MKAWRLAGFLALCGVWSLSWLAREVFPSGLSGLAAQAVHYAAIGAGTAVFVGWRGLRTKRWGRLAAAGVALLGAPAILLEAAAGGISTLTVSALLAAVPVVVVIAAAALGREGERRELLPAALAGLTGACLVFPVELPGSAHQGEAWAMAVGAVVTIGVAGVWIYGILGEFRWIESVSVICLANAVVLGLAAEFFQDAGWGWRATGREALAATVVDLPQMLLLAWLLRVVDPARFSARYLVVTLFALLESLVMIRPAVTVQAGAGIALLAGAAGWMLFRKQCEEPVRLVLD